MPFHLGSSLVQLGKHGNRDSVSKAKGSNKENIFCLTLSQTSPGFYVAAEQVF